MISIIIPVFNVERFIRPCIDSVLDQTYQDFELILVDDGSSDKSGLICDEYALNDTRVRVIHQTNAGVSAARNSGIKEAKGDWITFIDSDDYVENQYLENFRINDYKADLYIQGLKYVHGITGDILEKKNLDTVFIQEGQFHTLIPKYNIFGLGFPVCKCYKKCFLLDFGILFDEKISHHEDHIFVLEYLLYTHSILLSSGMMYNYRYFHNPYSLSRSIHSIESMKLAGERMFNLFLELVNKYKITDQAYVKSMGHICVKPVISSVMSNFGLNTGFDINIILNNIPSPSIIKSYYHPQDRKGKIFRFLFLHKLYVLLSCFLYIINKR